ncbi:MAG: GTP 3',8-cyclase MoaA [Phycisphaerae bacterium]|jgi:cyclic pyranopterin phosphate synthase
MLWDSQGRTIAYLRLSLTPACALRCTYCRPELFTTAVDRSLLTPAEIERIVAYLVRRHGLRKLRLTGGDPTSRPDLVEIIERVARIEGLGDLAMTTHGLTLAERARDYRRAGLRRINVSLDTLDPDQFQRITGAKALERVLAGIHEALRLGFSPVRLNTVVIADENEEQLPSLVLFAADLGVEIRFIELMPMGPLAETWHERFVPESRMRARLGGVVRAWRPLPRNQGSAKRWQAELRDGRSTIIGFITAMSDHFCDDCNRLRLTGEGRLYPCLMGEPAGDIMPAVRPEFDAELLDDLLLAALSHKQPRHGATGYAVMTTIGG